MLFHNRILHAVGVVDVLDDEFFTHTRGLDVDIAEAEKRGEDANDLNFDILNVFYVQFRLIAGEKADLLDIDYPLCYDKKHVEVIVRPGDKKYDPKDEKPSCGEEKRECLVRADKRCEFCRQKAGKSDRG